MRSMYLVAYDVADAKRLRRAHQTMRGYGDPLQFSVFLCRLSERERILMKGDILDAINQKEDRVVVIDLGPEGSAVEKRVEFIGVRQDFAERSSLIV